MSTAHTFDHEDSESPEECTDPQSHDTSGVQSVPPGDLDETSTETALFGHLSPSDRQFLVECRVKISGRTRTIAKTVFEIGDILNLAKSKLPHGSYLAWIKDVLGLADRTSQNYSLAAETFVRQEEREIISHLGPTAIYKLCGNDPRLVAARTKLLHEMSFGLRLKSYEVDEIVAIALRKSKNKSRAEVKAKQTKAEPSMASETQVSNPVCHAFNVETEIAVQYIFEPFREKVEELVVKLQCSEEHLVIKLLIDKCLSHLECVDTLYEPLDKLRIEDAWHGTIIKLSSETESENYN